MAYDALLLLSFGGPEGSDQVRPFLETVTRSRSISPARLDEVAAHYELFGGVSPINAACRALMAALAEEVSLPLYWGNRNWHPFLADTVATMRDNGVRRAVCFVTSAYGGYSACRQYLEDIAAARESVGPGAPQIDKLRPFFDHPGFIEPMVENVTAALATLDPRQRAGAHVAFCAHSVPLAQEGVSDYVAQLDEASRLVAEQVGGKHPWSLCWQSRSGPPSQNWLEPDVSEHLTDLTSPVVLVPIGFVADHMEVVYDLDVVAVRRARELGLDVVRASTVGVAPRFVQMIGELIAERTEPGAPRLGLGRLASRDGSDGC